MKKIPTILPIYLSNIIIIDFQEKALFFNDFFAKQCTLISYGSTPNCKLLTKNILHVPFCKEDIKTIIKTTNPKNHRDEMKYLFG